MFSSWKSFITWEKSTIDTIDVKKTYIDIADDFMAGVLLSQIVYWYLPNKDGKSKLRVKKDGHFWIAKKREEWYEEIRFSEANYKTAIKKLEKKNLVVKERFKFDGAPTTHIRLNIPEFLKALNNLMKDQQHNLDADFNEFDAYLEDQMSVEPLSPLDSVESTEWIRLNRPNPFGEIDRMDSVESNESLTKNTTKITNKDYHTEITNSSSSSYLENNHKIVIDKKGDSKEEEENDKIQSINPLLKNLFQEMGYNTYTIRQIEKKMIEHNIYSFTRDQVINQHRRMVEWIEKNKKEIIDWAKFFVDGVLMNENSHRIVFNQNRINHIIQEKEWLESKANGELGWNPIESFRQITKL